MQRNVLTSFIGIALICNGCANINQTNISRLDLIQKRGELICGVSGKIPGFSFLNSDGSYQGIDVDICKALAAGILGNKDRVQFRPLTAPERFTAIKTGEIDILSRNTTFNLSRDSTGGNGMSFGPVIFHDGQGLMVKKNKGIKSIKDLNNADICVGSGTTTEQNLNDAFQEKSLNYKPIKYQDLNQVIDSYLQGRCIAMTSDRSQLAAARSGFKRPERHLILDEVLSKEPLAPVSIGNDEKLSDAIRWIIYSLFAAEEYGIDSNNIDKKLNKASNNTNLSSLRRLFGIDGSLGKKLGLENDFVAKVIKSTGNYKEIYERHLGKESKVYIPRGLNKSYKDGGLHISPPLK